MKEEKKMARRPGASRSGKDLETSLRELAPAALVS
jgi:hypothetical protein